MRLLPTPRLPMTWQHCRVLTLALLNVFLAQLADSTMVEGDMAVPSVHGRLGNVQHSFVIAEDRLWPGGLVPFRFEKMELVGGDFEDLFRDEDMELIRSVLDEITEAVPCVRFREVANGYTGQCLIFTAMGDGDHPDQGCWSFVGNVGPQGGKKGQSLNLGQNCVHRGIVLHEVMHALGATHEQNRKDRDMFVKINHKNILTSARHNFEKKTEGFNTRGTPYDYESIMHYKAHDFSKNGQATITPLRPHITLRAKSELSIIDVVELSKVYDSITTTSCFSKEMLLRYATQLENMKDRSEQLFSKCEKYGNDHNEIIKDKAVWHGQCVKDTLSARVLPHEVKEGKEDRTPMNCIALCKLHGFLLAGVQYGYQCWCGNTPPPSTALTSESECKMPCPGDSRMKCGEAWRMNVYSPGGTLVLSNGPKCETHGRWSVKNSECLDVAKSHGYPVTHINTGSWTWAPYGCIVGHPYDNWFHLYFNTHSGTTSLSKYRTFCSEHQAYTP